MTESRLARKKLSIAILSVEYPPDPFSAGIGSYSRAIAYALTEQGHKVHIITRAPAKEINGVPAADSSIDEEGVMVHRLTPLRPELPEEFELSKVLGLVSSSIFGEFRYRHKISQTLQKIIRADGLDLIEAAEFMADGIFFPRRHHQKIPLVVRLHTPFAYAEKIEPHAPEAMRRLMAWLEKQHINKATHLSAPSGVSAEVFREELNIGPRHIEIIPNPPTFNVSEEALKDPSGNDSKEKIVLFVGRITKWKGADLLCESIEDVLEQHPDTQFYFVGADHVPVQDFPTGKAYLQSLVPEHFHHHMHFTGHLQKEDVQRHVQMATICVLPSRFESFGYTCLEAMHYGKAIVGSNNGGMKEMLDDNRAGLLYTPPDRLELTQHINLLLSDESLRQKLGQAARKRTLEVYNPDLILEQTLDFYYQAIEDCSQ